MSDFIKEIVELNENKALELLNDRISKGEDLTIITNEIKIAMKKIGEKFESKEYFLPDLIMSGEITRQIYEILSPKIKDFHKEEKKKGKVLLGTVEGDIHDIGKDIVNFMLDVNGFDVLDLGVDVPGDMFVKKIKEFKPKVLALSGFLTLSFDSMKEIIHKIEKAGLRDSIKIMIGGGTVDKKIANYVKADAFGESAVEAVNLATKWMEV